MSNANYERSPINPNIWVTVTKSDDPAMDLIRNPNIHSTPVIYKENCYICNDPEFAAMGMSLCYRCSACEGHVAADDTECDDCGADQYELHENARDRT